MPALGGDPQIVHDGDVTWNLGQTGLAFADSSIFDFNNSHRHYDAKFEWMDLEEFFELQYRIYSKFSRDPHVMDYIDYWRRTVSQENVKKLIDVMKSGAVFDALVVEVDKNGDLLDFQEGRHRSTALYQMGIKKIPVWIVKKRF
jgi:hypothetical protein